MAPVIQRLVYLLAAAVLVGPGCRSPSRTPLPGPPATATIADLKEFYADGAIQTVTAPYTIHAVVTASPEYGNFAGRIILEDATGGIELRIDDNVVGRVPRVGSSVALDAHGLAVGGFGGVVKLGREGVERKFAALSDTAIPRRLSAVGRPAPRPAKTVYAYALGPQHYSELVRVCGVQVAAVDTAGAYVTSSRARNAQLVDCAGNTLTLRTSARASFAKAPLPSGRGCVTGIVSAYRGDLQLQARTLEDVDLTQARCTPPPTPAELRAASVALAAVPRDSFALDFDGFPTREPFVADGWTNTGRGEWVIRDYKGNGYLQASAYGGSRDTVDAWLITPAINTASAKTLTFRTAKAYYKHDGLEVLTSADFVPGTPPRSANWRPLDPPLANAESADYEWVNSGDLRLPTTSETLCVAFRYRGAKTGGETTTFRLDDVSLKPH